MELKMNMKKSTATCYIFECGTRGIDQRTLYLKKEDIREAGIDPHKGIVVTVKEGAGDA